MGSSRNIATRQKKLTKTLISRDLNFFILILLTILETNGISQIFISICINGVKKQVFFKHYFHFPCGVWISLYQFQLSLLFNFLTYDYPRWNWIKVLIKQFCCGIFISFFAQTKIQKAIWAILVWIRFTISVLPWVWANWNPVLPSLSLAVRSSLRDSELLIIMSTILV